MGSVYGQTTSTPKKTVNKVLAAPKQGVHMTFEKEHLDIGKVKRGVV